MGACYIVTVDPMSVSIGIGGIFALMVALTFLQVLARR